MTVEERLSDLLDRRDEEVRKLERRIEELEGAADIEQLRWLRHETIQDDDPRLPVPRLEIVAEIIEKDYRWTWTYSMVYRHFLGHIVRVPLGSTDCKGGMGPTLLTFADRLPIRDGAHIQHDMQQLNLPGYAIFGGMIEQLEAK